MGSVVDALEELRLGMIGVDQLATIEQVVGDLRDQYVTGSLVVKRSVQ